MSDAWKFRAGLLALLGLLLAITLSHLGNDSPYTYGWAIFGEARRTAIEGQPVNPDALSIVPLTIGFLKPCGIAYDTPNVFIPLHSLVVASVVAFTHSYMLSHLIVNFASMALLMAAVLRIAREASAPPGAAVLAAGSMLLLPWVAHYAGQPLQYCFGISLDCLLTIAVVRQSEKETPSPWLAGAAIALMSLTYDWYVFAGAIVFYVLVFRRFARKRDYAAMLAVGLAPVVLWGRFLHWAAGAALNRRAATEFFDVLVQAWSEILSRPISRASTFFVLGHVAVDIMLRAVTALVWWPSLAAVIFLVVRRRAPALASAWGQMCISLLLVYVAEQLGTAAIVVANPRRAVPVMFAFSVALVWAIETCWKSKGHRALFVLLAALSGGLVFADTACNDPVVATLETEQMLRAPPKEPLKLRDLRLDREPRALMAASGPLPIGTFAPVCGQIFDPSWVAVERELPVKLGFDPPDTSALSPRRILFDFGVSLSLLVLATVSAAWVFVRARLISRVAALGAIAAVVLSLVARLFY